GKSRVFVGIPAENASRILACRKRRARPPHGVPQPSSASAQAKPRARLFRYFKGLADPAFDLRVYLAGMRQSHFEVPAPGGHLLSFPNARALNVCRRLDR